MPGKPSIAELRGLSADEKLQLIDDLWDSIITNPDDLPVPESQKRELDARLQAYRADPKAGSSWEEVERRITGAS